MAWVAVDKKGSEFIYEEKPDRGPEEWHTPYCDWIDGPYDYVELPYGSIKKLIGHELSWNDEPVKLEE